jgi:hypothetical protein
MDAKPTYVQEGKERGAEEFYVPGHPDAACLSHLHTMYVQYPTQEEKNQQRMWISVPLTFFFLSCLLACLLLLMLLLSFKESRTGSKPFSSQRAAQHGYSTSLPIHLFSSMP